MYFPSNAFLRMSRIIVRSLFPSVIPLPMPGRPLPNCRLGPMLREPRPEAEAEAEPDPPAPLLLSLSLPPPRLLSATLYMREADPSARGLAMGRPKMVSMAKRLSCMGGKGGRPCG